MRAVLTRVASASVEVDGVVTGRIGRGFLILLGVDVNWQKAFIGAIIIIGTAVSVRQSHGGIRRGKAKKEAA